MDFKKTIKEYPFTVMIDELRDLCGALHNHLIQNYNQMKDHEQVKSNTTLVYLDQMIDCCQELKSRLNPDPE